MTDISSLTAARLESGEIRDQKIWQFMREMNDPERNDLDLVALEDGQRKYSYRQMFGMWERYARVFSALGITGKNRSRAALVGTPGAEVLFAFFGLNMTGASVSLVSLSGERPVGALKTLTEREHVTDLILTDYELDGAVLRRILREKDEMGLRNVIVLHIPVCGDFAFPWEELGSRINHKRLREISGAVFMEDLLRKYKDHPISHADAACDEAAVIIHTSGTTEGVPKPVPLSDRAVIETVRRHRLCERAWPTGDRVSTILYLELSAGFSFMSMVFPFAYGDRLIVLPEVGLGYRCFLAMLHYRVNNIIVAPVMFETLIKLPFDFDLSSVRFVLLAGSFTSADAKKRYNDYLKRCGCKAKLMVGYGLSEAGVGCTLSDPQSEDESVGFLLPGVKAKLWDEDEERFHDVDGAAHTGVLYLSSPSLSSGRLDDEVLFELEEIDGEKYLNTYDLFTVREDGALYYLGRANKFFVNQEGVRFDAGLVERAVSAQKGIKDCGVAPEYNKDVHDTEPVLYAETDRPGTGGYRIVSRALEQVYITDGLIGKTALPVRCVLADEIPRTMTGKVDVHRITDGNVHGLTYRIEGVYENEKLKGIRLIPTDAGQCALGCDCAQ